MASVKQRYDVPPGIAGCHTALVDGYVVEGHVPAEDIERMLIDRPRIIGLAVPGMPVGSPGMEVPGMAPVPYNALAFDESGGIRIFSSH